MFDIGCLYRGVGWLFSYEVVSEIAHFVKKFRF